MLTNTRQKIIDSAIFTFNEDLSATLEQVALNAGMTRRTLHRYFKDRNELLVFCNHEMQESCSKAMAAAVQCSFDPLEQLQHLLYAAIDCGVKYAFLHKLHHIHGHHHLHSNKECARYDQTFDKVRTIIGKLQHQNIISKHLSVEWIIVLFPGIVTATISSLTNGTMDYNNVKKFAWYSFSKGIGIEN